MQLGQAFCLAMCLTIPFRSILHSHIISSSLNQSIRNLTVAGTILVRLGEKKWKKASQLQATKQQCIIGTQMLFPEILFIYTSNLKTTNRPHRVARIARFPFSLGTRQSDSIPLCPCLLCAWGSENIHFKAGHFKTDTFCRSLTVGTILDLFA